MSALGRAAVRFAARTLPPGIRERYREEWLADLEAAPAEGVNPAGIAVGALLFSATLNRDAPQLAGMTLTALAVRHARRSIAFFGVAAVLLFGTWINRQVGSATGITAIGGIVAASVGPWRALSIIAALAGIVYLWRAAMLTSALAKVSAALATTGAAAIVLALAFPALGAPPLLLGCAALIGSGVCGLVVWSSAPQPAPVPVPPAPALRLRGRIMLLLTVGGTLVVGCSVLISGFAPFGFAILAIGVAVTVSLTVMRQRLSAPRTSLRRPWLTVGLASLALLTLVTVGALDLLLWTPTAMAPGYTITEIYDALSPQDRIWGILMALIWIVCWAMVALAYLVVGLISARRPRADTRRNLVLLAVAIAAVAIFLLWFAGFSLGNSISDTLPPFVGIRTGFSALLGLVGQLCLCVVIFGWVAPRPSPLAAQPAAA